MPTQLLLDGDDLPTLLQRVRDEYGPDAVVVKAERVRTGGVAGFFAKEHFEVTVEVPEPRPSGRRARRLAEANAGTGLQALLDAADASDGDDDVVASSGSGSGHAAGSDHPAPVSTQGDTFAALLASIDGMSGTVPAPRESRDGGGAPEAPDAAPATRAARLVDKGVAVTAAAFGPLHPATEAAAHAPVGQPAPGAAVPPAPTSSVTAPAAAAPAAAAPAAAELATAGPGAREPVTAAPATPAGTTATPGTPGRPGVQPAMFARLPAGTPTTRDAAAVRAALAAIAGENGTSTTGASAPVADVASAPAGLPTDEAATAVAPATVGPALAPAPAVTAAAPAPANPTPPTTPATDPRADDVRRALAGVGIPATLLGEPTGDVLAALSGVVGRLPRTPSLLRAPGSLVAVLGEGPEVVAAAREIAQRAGLDPQDVALAGDLRPTDATDREVLTLATAPRQRSRTSTLGAVTVVAVAVGPDRDDRRAAAALVGELDPDQCVAVVDARRKSADLRAWMADVAGGRRFAGVAGTRVDETREPGTLLDLGVPVGWLDGRPATPVVWAAVLGEHLDHGVLPA